MNIQLQEEVSNTNVSIGLITQIVNLKIKYHENQIAKTSNEEDIKFRESKIKQLQNDFLQLRNQVTTIRKTVQIDTIIN